MATATFFAVACRLPITLDFQTWFVIHWMTNWKELDSGIIMRVNARFEGVAEKQVEYLATTLDTSVSEVLRESVDFYYRHTRAQGKSMKNFSALFGKGDSGLTDISTNVKKYVTMALNEKYPPGSPGISGKVPLKRTRTGG